MNENMSKPKKNVNLKSFGVEKPAIPGPGRPRLTPEEREERRILKDASPEAAGKLRKCIKSKNEKNAIRACEIILSKTVPNLTDAVIHDERPPKLAGEDPELLKQLAEESSGEPAPSSSGSDHVAEGL